MTIRTALLMGIGVLAMAAPRPSHAEPQAGVVLRAQGGVYARYAGRPILRAIAQGGQVRVGDSVLTGTDGEAAVRFDGRDIRLGPGSELILKAPEQKRGLWAQVRALFSSDDEPLTAAGGIRSGERVLKLLGPKGPISDASPVIRWASKGIDRVRVHVIDTKGFEMEWTTRENQLSLLEKKVKLAPGRYYLTVEAHGPQSSDRRVTVAFDVAESTPTPPPTK